MAVTKIWDIKGRLDRPMGYVMDKDKTLNPKYEEARLQALEDVIEYASDPKKTEQKYFVTAINCNTTCARRQFMNVKKHFGKEDGIIAYHGYQSFAPGEVSPDEAHQIGVELANKLWADRFQIIVSTHLNTDCVHNHILINSVSFRDGKKYYDSRASYQKMREVSDEICRQHGLSVIESPEKIKDPSNLHRMEKAGMPTRYSVTRQALDESISRSCNIRELEQNMKKLGYSVQFYENRKYWTVTPKGWKKPIRLARLGKDYTNERILQRINETPKAVRMEIFQKRSIRGRQYALLIRRDRIGKVGGLRGLYLRYCYELGYLPKYKKQWNKVHYLLKDELINCEKYSKQARLLGKYEIDTPDDLASFISEKKARISELTLKRDELRKIVRRVMPQDEKEHRKEGIREMTETLRKLRSEIRLAEDIERRSDDLQENLKRVEADRARGKERKGR